MMGDMDERELAAQIEGSRDDPEAWGEPVEPPRKVKSERRKRGAVVSVRLTVEELEVLQTYAESAGASLSAVLRTAGLVQARASAANDEEAKSGRRRKSVARSIASNGSISKKVASVAIRSGRARTFFS